MYKKTSIKKSLLLFIAISTLFSFNFLSLDNYQGANAKNNYNNTSLTGIPYTNSEFGISISYPNGWRADNETASILNKALENLPDPKIKYLSFFYANDSNISGLSPPYVALAIDENVKDQTLTQYKDSIKDLIGGNNFTSKETTLDNNSAIELNYQSTDINTKDLLNITNTVTMKDNKIYNIIFSASILDYQRFLPIVEDMKNSFKIQQ
jgi:hypothetical protein